MKSLIAMTGLLAAMTLATQAAADSLTKNAKGPISTISDHAETHNADCTAVLTGSAEALQDTSRLRADVMIAHLEIKKGKPGAATGGAVSNDCGNMVSLEAKGSVYLATTDGRRVHGDNGLYDSVTATYTITGDVTAVNGQNVMRGTKMVYNTETGEGHVEGSGKGAGAKNRPRGVFYPKDANDQGDASAGAKPKKAGK